MRSKISTWLQSRKTRTIRDPENIHPSGHAELPRLPSPRPRTLTPSPSQEPFARSSYSFFARLPLELRRQILIEAFGNRIIHMDLTHDHPVSALKPGESIPETHCGLNTTLETRKSHNAKLQRDYGQPERWEWFSCVCHRVHPKWANGFSYAVQIGGVCYDTCCSGYAFYCQRWPGDGPDKCRIGAMGWLLSCRQAYADGVEVLYGTNTIHMASEPMLQHLAELLLPQRLMNIRSLEIPIGVLSTPKKDEVLSKTIKRLVTVLDILTSSCHSLRRLVISIYAAKYPNTAYLNSQSIFRPIDEAVRKLPELRHMSLYIPCSAHRDLREAIPEDSGIPRENHAGQVWRSVGGQLIHASIHASENPRLDAEEAGYWIVSGFDDGSELMPSVGQPFW